MEIFTCSNGLSGKVVFAPITSKKDKEGELSFIPVGIRVFVDDHYWFYSPKHDSWTRHIPQVAAGCPLSKWDETVAVKKEKSIGRTMKLEDPTEEDPKKKVYLVDLTADQNFAKQMGKAKLFVNGKIVGEYVVEIIKARAEIIAEQERQKAERRAA